MKRKNKLIGIIALAVITMATVFTGCAFLEGITGELSSSGNGTYTPNPRPQGRLNGVWEDIYISRVEVDSEYITFYFENKAEGGDGYARSGRVNWDKGDATLTNLNRPSSYIKNSGVTGQGGGYVVSCVFPRIEGNRFKLENRQGVVFNEIILW